MAIDQIKNKKGSVWRSRLVLKSGKRISKCFVRKVDADQWEAKNKVDDGDPTKVRKEPIRFCDLADQFLKYAKPELQTATYQRYDQIIRNYLIPEFGRTLVSSISKTDVLNFKVKVMSLNLAQATKYFVFCTLRTVIKKGLEIDSIDHDPTLGVKAPKKGSSRTEYWNTNEIQQFLNRMSEHSRFPLYVIALNTGMRAGEIFGLQWDAVDFESGLIHVKRTLDQKSHILKETTKTHTVRSVGIGESLLKILRKLYQKQTQGFVIDRMAMGCGDTSHLARAFRMDCENVGIRPIKFHDLRHTFATQLVRKSGDIHAVANVMGHKTATMTERYAHFGTDHAVQIAKMISFDAEDDCKIIPLRAVN